MESHDPREHIYSDSEVRQMAEIFNSMPREPHLSSGISPNFWHFAIREIPFEPGGDMLVIVNPSTRFVYADGPIYYPSNRYGYLYLSTKARAILPYLLGSFITRFNLNDPRIPQLAPWRWVTDDIEFGLCMEAQMRDFGVCEALCDVDTCEPRDGDVAFDRWYDFVRAAVRDAESNRQETQT